MRYIALILSGIFGSGAAAAESGYWSDPTRPPAAFMTGAQAGPGDAGLRLQSVLTPRGGKQTAIISGQVMHVGEKIGDVRLLRLSEAEAVLKGPKGEERLFLVPDVNKTGEVQKTVATDREKRKKP